MVDKKIITEPREVYEGNVNLTELIEDTEVNLIVPFDTHDYKTGEWGKEHRVIKFIYIGKRSCPDWKGFYHAIFINRRRKHRLSVSPKRRMVGEIGWYQFRVFIEGENEFIDLDDPHTSTSPLEFERIRTSGLVDIYWRFDEILRRHGR